MSKVIEFIPLSKEASLVVPPPKPSKNYIPDWYKKLPAPNYKKLDFDNIGRIKNTNAKMCMPFLDSLTTGYIVESWTDIYIKEEKNGVVFNYPTGPDILKVRESGTSIGVDNNYHNVEFVWQEQWGIKTPKGWSCIFTHPLNNFELPFLSATAIIDSDVFYHTTKGQYPFYLKKGFEGIIPAGTPLYQIIPFKRDNWDSKIIEFNEEENVKNNHLMSKKFLGTYRDKFWIKKEYR
jgi:hypothetical protein